jgi:hypothetical protein
MRLVADLVTDDTGPAAMSSSVQQRKTPMAGPNPP